MSRVDESLEPFLPGALYEYVPTLGGELSFVDPLLVMVVAVFPSKPRPGAKLPRVLELTHGTHALRIRTHVRANWWRVS